MIINNRGWSDGAMVLGKFPVPGRPTVWITVGQGPTVLAVGAAGGCLNIYTHIYPFPREIYPERRRGRVVRAARLYSRKSPYRVSSIRLRHSATGKLSLSPQQ